MKADDGTPHDAEAPAKFRGAEPPSGRRSSSTATQLDADWLEALLRLSVELRIDLTLQEIAKRTVSTLAALLPDHALGVCVVDPLSGAQFVEARLPNDTTADHGRDPTRLFPRFAYEHVVMLDDDLGGSTLHLAGDDAGVVDPVSRGAQIVEQAARVLSSAMLRARAHHQVRETSGELNRLQAQVIQAEKLASLGQIVAGVVHELNNPLTSIVAYSDYLKKRADARGDADDLERLARIGEAAGRILKFSRDLVAYARPTSEIPGPVFLFEVVDKALVFCEHEFVESQVMVDSHVGRALPPVRGIAGQLIQVFVNLFTNAAHAMCERGGVLKVSAVPQSEDMRVEVVDEGVGIDEAVLDQIFEPFFTTKTDGRGTGLGLSIVRDIVTSHGGRLSAHSVVQRGTTFTLFLPLAACPPSMMPPR
jgi:two-component system, NtrC family, sensor kinase